MVTLLRNENGSVHPLMLLLFLAGFAFAVGILGLSRSWTRQVRTQLRLDECVGNTAHRLRDRLEAIDSANARIRAFRAAIAGALAATRVEAAAALRKALRVQVTLQNAEKWRWNSRRALWLARRGCDGEGDLAFPLPAIPWRRPPPDALGPRPLKPPQKPFHIEVRHENRIGAARVEKRRQSWIPLWSGPRLRRPDLR